MTGLLIADELSDAYHQLESFDAEAGDDGKSSHAAMTSALEGCAQRIESIAARFERA